MVTFCDCMTLLLCFFVLLLTFSSFEEIALDRLEGAMPGISFESIFPNRRIICSALLPPAEVQVDHTRDGSEKPTRDEPKNIKNPKPPSGIHDTEAYRDQKVVRIPSRKLFYARGTVMKDEGKALLDIIASFVAPSPCQIIIAETTGDRNTASSPEDIAVERAWAVMEYFTQIRRISPDRFSISGGGSAFTRDLGDEPAVEIVLLARSFYR